MIGSKIEMELRRKTEASDGMGGDTLKWSGLRRFKGVMTPLSSLKEREFKVNDKLTVTATHYFFLDYPYGIVITEEDILIWDNKTYEIIYVEDISLMRKKKLKITLKVKI